MTTDIDVKIATIDDLYSWMELVNLVRWNFPGLENDESLIKYKETVTQNINRESAFCAKHNEKVVGVLLFSVKHSMLSFMAVHPQYRRKSIATKMINLMLTQLPDNHVDIVVTTFRENDENGKAPRALYKKIGFIEDELCYEFDYPNQKFILHRE